MGATATEQDHAGRPGLGRRGITKPVPPERLEAVDALANDPGALRALSYWVRRYRGAVDPLWHDELESAAYWGLYRAARSFDPSLGVEFVTHATHAIRGEIQQALRSLLPRGFGRHRRASHPGEALPRAVPLDEDFPSDEPAAGWDLEYEEAVWRMSRRLPPRHAAAFRLHHLFADCARQKAIGPELGVCESRVAQLIGESHALLAAEKGGAA